MSRKLAEPITELGRRLRTLRIARGLRQDELAQRAGVTQRIVSFYELQCKEPSAEQLGRIAKALHVNVDVLLGQDALKIEDTKITPLVRKIRQAEELPEEDQRAIVHMIDHLKRQRQRLMAAG